MIKNEGNKEKIKQVFKKTEEILDILFNPSEKTFGNILLNNINEAKKKSSSLNNIIQYIVDLHNHYFSEKKINLQEIDNNILKV
jgi:hypothetical protein